MSLYVDVEGIYPAAYWVFMCRLYNHARVMHGLPFPPLLRYSIFLSYLYAIFCKNFYFQGIESSFAMHVRLFGIFHNRNRVRLDSKASLCRMLVYFVEKGGMERGSEIYVEIFMTGREVVKCLY